MYEMTRPMVNFRGKYSMCPQSSHISIGFVVRRYSYDIAVGKNTADLALQVRQPGQRIFFALIAREGDGTLIVLYCDEVGLLDGAQHL